ncbi:MAG: L,D-transpeptidase family protein [Clostridia bacterium]|nr:L,D-transpeptidase family protein [Clostridia bacterium]
MRIEILKAARRLAVLDAQENMLFSCAIALGRDPLGPKQREGDGKTPEGRYYICLKKQGKYGPSLGVSYPNAEDALRAGAPEELIDCILRRTERKERPPWGTALGGEIYIHGGGTASDWTAGCIALKDEDAETLYRLIPLGTDVILKA